MVSAMALSLGTLAVTGNLVRWHLETSRSVTTWNTGDEAADDATICRNIAVCFDRNILAVFFSIKTLVEVEEVSAVTNIVQLPFDVVRRWLVSHPSHPTKRQVETVDISDPDLQNVIQNHVMFRIFDSGRNNDVHSFPQTCAEDVKKTVKCCIVLIPNWLCLILMMFVVGVR
jgi:hypothetical protein